MRDLFYRYQDAQESGVLEENADGSGTFAMHLFNIGMAHQANKVFEGLTIGKVSQSKPIESYIVLNIMNGNFERAKQALVILYSSWPCKNETRTFFENFSKVMRSEGIKDWGYGVYLDAQHYRFRKFEAGC
mgnify:CR=1 FL=1